MSCKKATEPTITNVVPERPVPKKPYAYVLTTAKDRYIGTYPTLRSLAVTFGISSVHVSPENRLMRAVWEDGRAFFVPHDLVFEKDVHGFPRFILLERIPEHFLERNIEDYLVQHFWWNEELKARGFPEERLGIPGSPYNYTYPPECIPKIGWVGEDHPLHSSKQTTGPKKIKIRAKKVRNPDVIKQEFESVSNDTDDGNILLKRQDLLKELGRVIGRKQAEAWVKDTYSHLNVLG